MKLQPTKLSNTLSVTWIPHSSFYLSENDLNFSTTYSFLFSSSASSGYTMSASGVPVPSNTVNITGFLYVMN